MAEQEHLETCANCGRTVGASETPMVWQEKLVCPECHGRLEQNPPDAEAAFLRPAAPANGITELPEPLQCPESWKYTKEWNDAYAQAHGNDYLSKRCRHSGADFQIMYYIYCHGEGALTQIKKQNLLIKRIAAGTVSVAQIRENDIGSGWAYFYEWWEELFAIYNAHLAPPDILNSRS